MQILKGLLSWLLSYGGIVMGGVSGIFSYFSENKTGKFWKTLPLFGVLGGMVWALASAYSADREQQEKMEAAINRIDEYVRRQSTATVALVDTNTRAAINELLHLGVLPQIANAATPSQARALVNAGFSASRLVDALPADRRDALTIWVFPHVQQEVDYSIVETRLHLLAKTVALHQLRQTQSVTNSVWYGGGASLEEAKAATLIVASAGVQIRQICPSMMVQQQNLLQIGGSSGAAGLPVLSPAQIQALASPVCEPLAAAYQLHQTPAR